MSYDPTVERWMEQDPAMVGNNLYQSFGSNPVDETDPLGLDPRPDIIEGPNLGKNPNNGDETASFFWVATGLDSTKSYAQVNVRETTITVDGKESPTTTSIIIDPVTLATGDTHAENPLGGPPLHWKKGETLDEQAFGQACTDKTTKIVIRTWIYIVEITNPSGKADEKSGYGTLTNGQSKITATDPPMPGNALGTMTANYGAIDLAYEWTYIYVSDGNKSYAFFHGNSFDKKNQPEIDDMDGNPIKVNGIEDPDAALVQDGILKHFPAK